MTRNIFTVKQVKRRFLTWLFLGLLLVLIVGLAHAAPLFRGITITPSEPAAMDPVWVAAQVTGVGGEGGRIEEYDWDGNMVWAFDYYNATYMAHHLSRLQSPALITRRPRPRPPATSAVATIRAATSSTAGAIPSTVIRSAVHENESIG